MICPQAKSTDILIFFCSFHSRLWSNRVSLYKQHQQQQTKKERRSNQQHRDRENGFKDA